jgi:hypothetical protein
MGNVKVFVPEFSEVRALFMAIKWVVLRSNRQRVYAVYTGFAFVDLTS